MHQTGKGEQHYRSIDEIKRTTTFADETQVNSGIEHFTLLISLHIAAKIKLIIRGGSHVSKLLLINHFYIISEKVLHIPFGQYIVLIKELNLHSYLMI